MRFFTTIGLLFLLLLLKPTASNALPVVSFAVSDTCLIPFAQFVDQSTSAGQTLLTWQWDFGDPASGSNNSSSIDNPTHAFSSAGIFVVSLTVTDDLNNTSNFTRSVTIKPAPHAAFTATSVCNGDMVLFTNQSDTTGVGIILSSHWDFGDGTSSLQFSPSKIYPSAGSFPVLLLVNAANGCSDTMQAIVKVHDYPVMQISSNLVACPNVPLALTDLSTVYNGSIAEHHWNFGVFGSDTGAYVNPVFAAAGDYPVHLLVITDGGCRDSLDTIVHVATNPIASFTTSLNIGSAPLEVSFTNHSSGAVSYAWNFGNATLSALQDPFVTYTDTGRYTIELVATSIEGCVDTAHGDAWVRIPQFDIALTDLMLSHSGSLYTVGIRLANLSNVPVFGFTMKADFGGDARLLETRTDTLLPGEEKVYYFNGQYEYKALLGDAFFCAEVSTLAGLTEVGLANNKQCRLLGGEFYLSEPYPNPAKDNVVFSVILPEAGEVDLTVSDLMGRTVYHALRSDASSGLNNWSVDVSLLRIGVYTCRAVFQDQAQVKRWLKF